MTSIARSAADRSERIVKATFARLDITAFAIATGALCAAVIALATLLLVVRGAPPGEPIGPHLGLLASFLPGYSVSWSGSAVGLMYGFLLGAVVGGGIGVFWNLVHQIMLMLVYRRMTADSGLDI